MTTQFPRLFTPIKIGNVIIKNRIVSLPHGTRLGADSNSTERETLYFAEKAKGGTGLIIHGALEVDETTHAPGGYVRVDRDECIPSLKRVADYVHKYEAKIIGQLHHLGRNRYVSSYIPSIDVSPFPEPIRREFPREIEVEDIKRLVEGYGQCAKRVVTAGYDGVELHSAHGYLLSGFLNPNRNKREDEYGESLENRSAFAFEALKSIRSEIGDDPIVGIRINGDDFEDGGFNLSEAVQLAKNLETSGLIDYISVSQGTYANYHVIIPPMYVPLGAFVYISAEVKRAVELPVICAGRIIDPIQAERVLEEGQADLIGMCRSIICDPHWANKAREGRIDDIRTCVACNQSCRERTEGIACTQNPVIGREKLLAEIPQAENKKRVVVVGGGPAGLETARVASLRGHDVTLYEKRDELGGQVALVAKDSVRHELGDIVRYLAGQVAKCGVKVHLNSEFTPETAEVVKPDVIVVATGSVPLIPPIPGSKGPNVLTSWEVLEGKQIVGRNVVVVGGLDGHQPPLTIAENLADKGKKVILLSELPVPGMDIEFLTAVAQPLYTRLFEKKVQFKTFTQLKEIRGTTLIVANRFTKEEESIEGIDAVVFSMGGKANTALYRALKGKVKELYMTGDCEAPRRIPQAIYSGHMRGRQI